MSRKALAVFLLAGLLAGCGDGGGGSTTTNTGTPAEANAGAGNAIKAIPSNMKNQMATAKQAVAGAASKQGVGKWTVQPRNDQCGRQAGNQAVKGDDLQTPTFRWRFDNPPDGRKMDAWCQLLLALEKWMSYGDS